MAHATALRAILVTCLLWGLATPVSGQPTALGVAYLETSQAVDGGWDSPTVRRPHATAAVLRALQTVGDGVSARFDGADFLEATTTSDNDDTARRLEALSLEGRDGSGLRATLVAAAVQAGGWGLTGRFAADPLDTSLALLALAPTAPAVSDDLALGGLSYLTQTQRPDGGFPCVAVDDADSEIYCTGYAVLALHAFSQRYFLTPQIDAATGFLRARLEAGGRLGPAGSMEVLHTALGSLALATIPAVSSEVPVLRDYLVTRQLPNGSWDDDPYITALALRALTALDAVPICGDLVLNQSEEECDGLDLGGLTCDALGLGTGELTCTATCTLDRSGCSGPPACGDDVINQIGEACDGPDLAGQTCEALGLGPGDLTCSSSCTFDTSGCADPPACGDGLINQPTESCDGTDLGGVTCQDVGFLGGTLGCFADCTLDASGCEGVPFCGDGEINRPEEECDGTDLAGLTCDALGLGGGNLGCSSSCTLQTAGCFGSGATDPQEIEIAPESPVCAGGAAAMPVSITFPSSSVIDKVDVFLLFDDTGSFASRVPAVSGIFSQLVDGLQTALPDISFGFGVGRFEDYGGPGTSFSGERSTGRPFTLNQPVVTTDTPDFLNLINAALARSAPGFGGDGPETNFDGLYQTATGAGFDGNGNGSLLDSGPAGVAGTQVSPGSSGDIPPFSSNVATTSGTLGGAGFRPGALHLIIQAGDVCTVAPYRAETPIPSTLTGAGGATVPSTAMACTSFVGRSRYGFESDSVSRSGNTVSGAVAPRGAATVPETIAALNQLGISVIGLAPGGTAIRNPVGPSTNESVMMSAVALLTGAVDETGLPLVFNISGGSGPVRDAIVQAVTTAATRPVDVTLAADDVPAGLSWSATPVLVPDLGPGGTAEFEVIFTGDGSVIQGDFDLRFVDFGTNATLAVIPVRVGCLPGPAPPVDEDGDGYPEDEDCNDLDPDVNPGTEEIPGNGVDDDCNPGTPDEIPQTVAICGVTADKIAYQTVDVARFDAHVTSLADISTLSGLDAVLTVFDDAGATWRTATVVLPALTPGSRLEETFEIPLVGASPGDYLALLTVTAGAEPVTLCSAAFAVEGSAATGVGLEGILALDPDVVDAGDPTNALYTVVNQGNERLVDLGLRIRLVDPDSGQVLAELVDVATLSATGGSYASDQRFSTVGLAPRSYLGVLSAVLADGSESTLDSDVLTVVNVPPDCTAATATPESLWPPNHSFEELVLGGVTDADDDPLTFTVVSVFQDEPTDEVGEGATCPDALGTGTAVPRVRRERSGTGDGRVYHVRFVADDGRGGTCEAVATACVPHDKKDDCIDQGPLFDASLCPSN